MTIIVTIVHLCDWSSPREPGQAKWEKSCKVLLNNQEYFSMKRSKFSEQQIAFILRQAEEGVPVGEVCRKVGISEQTYYRWWKRYGGMMPSEMKRLKQLEEENMRLKRLVADLSLDKEMLQEVVRKKL